MLNDSLANALSKILNSEKIGKNECSLKPVSKILKTILGIMKDMQYIGDFKEHEDTKGNSLTLNLLGRVNNCGAIKPRFSVQLDNYEKFERRYLPAKDFGVIFVSTNQGIMTHVDAKKKKLGGKLLAFVY